MVCFTCLIAMKTIDGFEKGEMRDDYYFTEEVKVCPTCKKMVKETYSAELIKEDNLPIIQEKI